MTEDQMMMLFIAGVIGGNLYVTSLAWRFTNWLLNTYAENYIREKQRKS